jgi:hypothetical protein
MTIASSSGPSPRVFQFRLATLLIAMSWAGLVSLGLRSPTALWSGVIAVLTLLTVLMAVLVVIYRSGRTRAMAIGFLVFCVGYLAYLAILAGTLREGLSDVSTPIGSAFNSLFDTVHAEQDQGLYDPGGIGGMAGPVAPDPFAAPDPIQPIGVRARSFDRRDFITICNHAVACLLGVAGAVAAQFLFATRKEHSHS